MTRTTRRIAASIGLVFVMTLALVPAASARTPNYSWQMYRETNSSRVRHSVKRLDRAHRLTQAVTRHSRAMARRGDLFHSSGPRSYGVRCRTWGENVGYTSGDVDDLQRAFMHSPSHRSNVLNRRFRRVAVGSATDNRGRLWVTVFFCA
jgi:uncharacterized protein YkwD